MKKSDVLYDIAHPQCEVLETFDIKNGHIDCKDCAMRFTHLCDKPFHLNELRQKVYDMIKTERNGLKFINKEKCQITVLQAEQKLKR